MGEEAGRACPLTMGRPGDCPGALWSPATNGEPEAELTARSKMERSDLRSSAAAKALPARCR